MAKILMIDDDPDILTAIRIPLEASGYEFFEALTGSEGLEKIKQINPDLIILDVMMETATEGFQLSHKVRDRSPNSEFAAYRDIPILMLTAIHTTTPLRFTPDEDYLPVDAFLDKSADPDVLMAKAIRIVAGLYKDGILKKPENYAYPFPDLLTFHDAPTPVEQELFVMFLEHRMRTFQGTFHANPDYALWYGWSEMRRSLSEIKHMAEELREKHSVN